MPDGKDLPKRLLDRHNYVWVAHDGYLPLRAPSAKSEPSGATALEFMELCGCVAEWQSDSRYLLLTKGKPGTDRFRHLGWVDARRVVVNPFALQGPTRIYRKAMVVNTVESIKEGKKVREAPVLLGPDAKAKPASTFRLFNIYFIYADSYPPSPMQGFYLLGTAPQFDENRAFEDAEVPRRVVLGWVPKSRICHWDTREALEWDHPSTRPEAADKRRRTPGRVYRTREDAIKALDGHSVDPLFEEVFDGQGVSKPVPYDRMRFPLVPIRGSDDELKTAEGGELQKVGVVAGFVNDQGQMVATIEEIEDLQRKLRRVQDEVRVTEVLFVIDDTASMDVWFKPAGDTIQRIIDSVRADKKRKVRIGLTYYNDIPNKKKIQDLDKAVKTWPLVDADSPQAAAMVKDLREIHQVQDGGDAREQVFHGLKRGIEDARFQRYSRKIVVLIGDMADHDTDADGKHTAERAVVRKLVPEDQSPIEFYAIQVIDPDKNGADAKGFQTQMQTIIKLFDEELEKIGLKESKKGVYVQLSESKEVCDHILARYKQLARQATEFEEQLAALQRGQWDGTRIAPELERILKDKDIDLDKLRKSAGLQLFHYGYIWENSRAGVPQTRVKLLVSDGELEKLLEPLRQLQSPELEKQPTAETLARVLVGSATGEQADKNASFESARLKAYGLKVQSPLLKRSLRETRFDFDAQQELRVIYRKRQMLEEARNNLASTYQARKRLTPSGEELTVWEKSDPKPRERRFYLSGDRSTIWYWLDYDEEWP
jgi:hypothetical protein